MNHGIPLLMFTSFIVTLSLQDTTENIIWGNIIFIIYVIYLYWVYIFSTVIQSKLEDLSVQSSDSLCKTILALLKAVRESWW